jgi:hypothetical protein
MTPRTEERVEDLTLLINRFRKMAYRKGLTVHDYLDVLTASLCSTSLRNGFSRKTTLEVIDYYWDKMEKSIEADKFGD